MEGCLGLGSHPNSAQTDGIVASIRHPPAGIWHPPAGFRHLRARRRRQGRAVPANSSPHLWGLVQAGEAGGIRRFVDAHPMVFVVQSNEDEGGEEDAQRQGGKGGGPECARAGVQRIERAREQPGHRLSRFTRQPAVGR